LPQPAAHQSKPIQGVITRHNILFYKSSAAEFSVNLTTQLRGANFM